MSRTSSNSLTCLLKPSEITLEQHDIDEIAIACPPSLTLDPAKASMLEAMVSENVSIFSQNDEPSNADKFEHIKNVFDNQKMTITMRFPYDDVFEQSDITLYQAAAFLADLRCQYITELLRAEIIDERNGYLFYIRNRVWYVRMREQFRICLLAMQLQEDQYNGISVH